MNDDDARALRAVTQLRPDLLAELVTQARHVFAEATSSEQVPEHYRPQHQSDWPGLWRGLALMLGAVSNIDRAMAVVAGHNQPCPQCGRAMFWIADDGDWYCPHDGTTQRVPDRVEGAPA